jgi:DNA-binding NarL/FixJ family response regulator
VTARNPTQRRSPVKTSAKPRRFQDRDRWIAFLAREGIPVAAIAERYGLAESTVRKIVSQAAKRGKRKGRA